MVVYTELGTAQTGEETLPLVCRDFFMQELDAVIYPVSAQFFLECSAEIGARTVRLEED